MKKNKYIIYKQPVIIRVILKISEESEKDETKQPETINQPIKEETKPIKEETKPRHLNGFGPIKRTQIISNNVQINTNQNQGGNKDRRRQSLTNNVSISQNQNQQ